MKPAQMLSVEQALTRVLDGANMLGKERVELDQLTGRIAAADHLSQISQPPFAASAMDGYAVKFEDAQISNELTVIGEVKAGAPSDIVLGVRQAVRIFTGAAVPSGANHVIIQEDVVRRKDTITVIDLQSGPRNIRKAGVDFAKGTVLAKAGDVLNEIHGALFAAANLTHGSCVTKPRVAFFSNGDELRPPGSELKPGQIINSNRYALSALIQSWGGVPIYLGCAPDDLDSDAEIFEKAKDADVIISVGGASVGDYDFVKTAFSKAGGVRSIDKVAVRPGKPTWFGFLGNSRVIGLPGNPASAIVAATLFAKPLIQKLAGYTSAPNEVYEAVTNTALPPNGARETYLRAQVGTRTGAQSMPSVTPHHSQDSSLLLPFADCNALIRREIDAPRVDIGEIVEIIRLDDHHA